MDFKKGEKIMKTSKIISGIFILITLVTINSLATNVSAQEGKERKKCLANVTQIYFVDSGQTVTEIHPGSNGGNGYQLNILGSGVDNFEVVQARYMTSLYLIPNYTNATSAKWGMTFAANMGRMIPEVKLKDKCTNQTKSYRLVTKIKLLDN
jgi:hypothetical protein